MYHNTNLFDILLTLQSVVTTVWAADEYEYTLPIVRVSPKKVWKALLRYRYVGFWNNQNKIVSYRIEHFNKFFLLHFSNPFHIYTFYWFGKARLMWACLSFCFYLRCSIVALWFPCAAQNMNWSAHALPGKMNHSIWQTRERYYTRNRDVRRFETFEQ